MKVVLIVNPTSGIGRGARVLARLRGLLARRGVTDIRETGKAGDTQRFTRAAVEDGADAIMALGGDGTWSQAAATIAELRAPTPLALLAAGTGNDFVRTLELPARNTAKTLDLIDARRCRAIDMGRAGDVFFLNSIGFGFDAHVLERMTRPPWIPAKALYAWIATQRIARYEGVHASIDGAPAERFLALVVANGKRFGALFWIAPKASLEDGELDLVAVGDASLPRRLALISSVMRGVHEKSSHTQMRRARSFRLEFDAPPVFQADGEVVRATQRVIDVVTLPRALNLVAE